MELFKAYQISADYKDPRGSPNWESRVHAEILFIDRTNQGASHQVYILKDSYLPLESAIEFCKNHPTQFSRDGFVLMGDELTLDRKKKQIILNNKKTISYNHLLVISGTKNLISFENEELLAALQALSDALRVKPKIPSSFATSPYGLRPVQEPHLSLFDRQSQHENQSMQNIDKLVQPSFTVPHGLYYELNTLNKRLYEVQL